MNKSLEVTSGEEAAPNPPPPLRSEEWFLPVCVRSRARARALRHREGRERELVRTDL